MNQTNYNVLKLLLQQSLKENEILKYLNINKNTLKKAIEQINLNLKSLNLSTIKEKNNKYELFLSKMEKELFYNSCNNYSQHYRINYLILKLLIEKKLNLENEKKVLNISRATIARDILAIKIILNEKNISLISKKWDGIFYTVTDNTYLYEYICEILIVFYLEYDNLPGILKVYLESLQPESFEKMLKNLFKIYDNFKVQIGDITIRYLLALRVCFYSLSEFHLITVEKHLEKIKNTKFFQDVFKKLLLTQFYQENQNLYITMTIYDIKYKTFYLEDVFNENIDFYCNYFKVTLNTDEKYLLNFFLYLSSFRKKHSLYDVKSIYLTSEIDEKILKLLIIFLKKINHDVLYGDLLELLDFTKFFFIENNKKIIKKILILKKDINLNYYSDLEEFLKNKYPNFNFKIKPYMYIHIETNIKNKYDLVLSDTILDLDFTYKLCQINMSLFNIIDNYLIEDYLKNFIY